MAKLNLTPEQHQFFRGTQLQTKPPEYSRPISAPSQLPSDVDLSSADPDPAARLTNDTEVDRFLMWIGEPTLLVAIKDGSPPRAKSFKCDNDVARLEAIAWIRSNNEAGYNVYWTPNATSSVDKKPRKADITAWRYIWVDIDPNMQRFQGDYQAARDEVLGRAEILQTELYPALIIDSGNGVQALWRFRSNLEAPGTDNPSPEIESRLRTLNQSLGGDNVHNCDRILRVPGTSNWPSNAKLKKGYPDTPRASRILSLRDEDAPLVLTHIDWLIERVRNLQADGHLPTASQSDDRTVRQASLTSPAAPADTVPDHGLQSRLDAFLARNARARDRWRGSTNGLTTDMSGSAMDMSMASHLAHGGFSKREVGSVLRDWPHGSQADRNDESRYERRIDRIFAELQPDQRQAEKVLGPSDEEALTHLDLVELELVASDPIGFKVDPWLPERAPSLLHSHGGVGKSFVANIELAVCLAAGIPWFDQPVKRSRVVVISAEDDKRVLKSRLMAVCRKHGIKMSSLTDWLFVYDMTECDVAMFRDISRQPGADPLTPVFYAIKKICEAKQIDVLVVDNASDTFTGREIDRAQVRQFVRSLLTLVAVRNGAVVLLAHDSKQGARGEAGEESYSGSTAWHNSVRSRWSLAAVSGGSIRLSHAKANWGRPAKPIDLRWDAVTNTFVLANSATRDRADDLHAAAARLAVLQEIAEFTNAGVRLTPAVNSRKPIVKTLQLRPRMKELGIGKDRLKAILDQFQLESLLHEEQQYDGESRNHFRVAALTADGWKASGIERSVQTPVVEEDSVSVRKSASVAELTSTSATTPPDPEACVSSAGGVGGPTHARNSRSKSKSGGKAKSKPAPRRKRRTQPGGVE